MQGVLMFIPAGAAGGWPPGLSAPERAKGPGLAERQAKENPHLAGQNVMLFAGDMLWRSVYLAALT
jgi:hypothetical protein